MNALPVHVETAQPPDGGAYRWYAPHEYGARFDGRYAVRARRLEYIAASPADRKWQAGKGTPIHLLGNFELPNGKLLQDAMSESRPLFKVPAKLLGANDEQRAQQFAGQRLVQQADRLNSEMPHLAFFGDKFVAELMRRCGTDLRSHGLPTSGKRLRVAYDRAKNNEPVNGRVATSGRKRDPLPEAFVPTVNSGITAKRSISTMLSECEVVAEQLGVAAPKEWMIRRYRSELNAPVTTMIQDGETAFKRKRLPRIKRCYDKLAPFQIVVFDGSTLNLMAQRIFPDGEITRDRPLLILFEDLATRRIVGWQFGWSERWEYTLVGSKMVLREATPETWYYDNGSSFLAALGSAWEERFGLLARELGSKIVNSIPGEPEARGMIERLFGVIHESFERDAQFEHCYWGRDPSERPEGADEYTRKHPEQLPTLKDLDRAFGDWVKVKHETAHSGDGMRGLSPRQKHDAWMKAHPEFKPLRHDKATIDFAASRIVGPRTVGRDGVQWQNEYFGDGALDVMRLQDRKVWLRLDPEYPAMIVLTEEDGTPILDEISGDPVIAMAGILTDRTPEEQRFAHAQQKSVAKSIREYCKKISLAPLSQQQTMLTNRAKAADAKCARERAAEQTAEPRVRLAITSNSAAAQKIAAAKAELQEAPRRAVAARDEKPKTDVWELLARAARAEEPVDPYEEMRARLAAAEGVRDAS